MSLKSTIVYNRIKKIMQSDENVGKVAAGSTYVAGKYVDGEVHNLLEVIGAAKVNMHGVYPACSLCP